MKNVIVGLAAVAGLAGVACAQGPGGWVISVTYGGGGTSVRPGFDTATVRVSATHHSGDYAVAGVRFNLIAGEAGWNPVGPGNSLPPMNTGSNPGTVAQPNVNGIIGGQLNFPAGNIFADPASPIGVWQGTWTTANFTTRQVSLATQTIRFDCYPSRTSPSSTSRLAGLVEGRGVIEVTPAPSALALLGLGGLIAGRRRR